MIECDRCNSLASATVGYGLRMQLWAHWEIPEIFYRCNHSRIWTSCSKYGWNLCSLGLYVNVITCTYQLEMPEEYLSSHYHKIQQTKIEMGTLCKFAVWLRELKLMLYDKPEECDRVGQRFKREGTYLYLWLMHVDILQKPTEYCKTIILQLKINKFLKWNDQ